MSTINFKKLQNGSDIRGVAIEGVPGETVTLDSTATYYIALGFLRWLGETSGKGQDELVISIGHDSRISAEGLKDAFCSALIDENAKVFDCGLASTPSMFMSTIFPEFSGDGAVMITASHLPFHRNGFKFFCHRGGLDKKDISKILEYAEQLYGSSPDLFQPKFNPPGNSPVQKNILPIYSAFLRDKIKEQVNHPTNYDKPLSGLKIIVDAGNGSGGFYATDVLAPLGADISGSQFLAPDGMFPNHIPNPEDKTAMASISQAVITHNADFGLIFDTDVDRSSAVDKYGREINRNAIVALASALICEQNPGSTIVTDSVTSDELTEFLEGKLGCKHHRFQRGYKNVINEALRLNEAGINCQLAIETSGHAALKENYFLDDGAYLATRIVSKAAALALSGKTIDALLCDLKQPLESVELRFPIQAEDFSSYGDRVISELELFAHVSPGMMAAIPNYEGVRISFDKSHGGGWCLLRKSLHDPLMPMNIESNEEGGCRVIGRSLLAFLKRFDQLDLSKLEQFCS